MNKAVILAPLALAAVGAVVLVAMKKPAGEAPAAKKAAPAKGKAKAAPAMDLKPGSYTFISGFKDAAMVEVGLQYDAASCEYAVIEEDFPAYTSDSHSGEDFAGLKKSLGERYEKIDDVAFGANKAIQFVDGDNICIAVPVDQYSYLLATLIKGKEYDDDFRTLPDYPPVKAVLDSLKFTNVG